MPVNKTAALAGLTDVDAITVGMAERARAVPAELGPFPKLNPEYVLRLQPDIVMALRQGLAWVAQEPFLFSACIAENIALAKPAATPAGSRPSAPS